VGVGSWVDSHREAGGQSVVKQTDDRGTPDPLPLGANSTGTYA
jgi:hypothetical protein